MKYLYVKAADGAIFRFKVALVANDFLSYHPGYDSVSDFTDDENEVWDWARNNMDWDDLEPELYADPVERNYAKEWPNMEMLDEP